MAKFAKQVSNYWPFYI